MDGVWVYGFFPGTLIVLDADSEARVRVTIRMVLEADPERKEGVPIFGESVRKGGERRRSRCATPGETKPVGTYYSVPPLSLVSTCPGP